MNRDEYLDRFKNLNLEKDMLESKWRAFLEEQHLEQQRAMMMFEAARASSSASDAAAAGGGGSVKKDDDAGKFISVWDTTLGNGFNTIVLPLQLNGTYDFTVEWGDGTSNNVNDVLQGAQYTHTYSNSGNYTIKISGVIQGWSFGAGVSTDYQKIISITNWGVLRLVDPVNPDYGWYFDGCSNLDLSGVKDVLNLEGVTNLSSMFSGTNTSINKIEQWDFSNVTDMSYMFSNTQFNQDISSWNVSNVNLMEGMFYYASQFNNGGQPLNWGNKTSNVNYMSYMFGYATVFNQDISSWNVSNVLSTSGMFSRSNFNQDISGWDVSKVVNMSDMFKFSTQFNNGGQPLNWGNKTGNVQQMQSIFYGANSFNQDISGWDVSKVVTMEFMFYNATSFNIDISSWDISSVLSMINFMTGKSSANYNTSYYDNILNSWVALPGLENNVGLNMGSIKYTAAGAASRNTLVTTKGWTISDGGQI